jgi:hypothetical protein
MRKSLNRIAAGVTALATVGSMFLSVAPVHAAPLTSLKDTVTREQISVTAVGHVLSATVPSISTGTVILFDYATAGFTTLSQNGATGSCASGTCTLTVSATDVRINCTAGPCSGAFTQTGSWTATNPGSAGSKTVSYAQVSGDPVSGTLSIPIVDSDQVTVTATVAPSITFDIDTAQTDTESAAPYSVALGTITTTDTRVSGTTDGINFIWLDLDTNATGGAVITVRNANGGNGLVSTAVGTDNINSADGTMADGTENYGICSVSEADGGGNLDDLAPYDGTCAADAENNVVGGLLTTPTPIYDTDGAAIVTARAQIAVNAAISTTTAAHNDYTDTLTFIATGTF